MEQSRGMKMARESCQDVVNISEVEEIATKIKD